MAKRVYLDGWAVLKITLVLMISLPFWCWPLFFGAIVKYLDWQQSNIGQSAVWSIVFWYGMIPFIYAYLLFLYNLYVIRMDKIAGKLKIYTVWQIFKRHSQSFLRLSILSLVDIVTNNFHWQSLSIALSLSVFYLSTEIFEYFYRKIIRDAPLM
jgi:hypothetical protein